MGVGGRDGEGPGLGQGQRQVAQHGGQGVLLLVPRVAVVRALERGLRRLSKAPQQLGQRVLIEGGGGGGGRRI